MNLFLLFLFTLLNDRYQRDNLLLLSLLLSSLNNKTVTIFFSCFTVTLLKFALVYSWRMTSIPPDMIYFKCQGQYYWCFYGILRQLLLMSPLAFATMSGAPLFSEAAARWETLHHPERGTWDESVHMCHAGGHRQCVISDSFPAMSPPTTGQQRLPKPKLYFPEMRQRQLKLVQSDWGTVQNTVGHMKTVQDSDSK